MAISKGDILFYFDHSHKSILPQIGGKPRLLRFGNAYSQLSNGQHVEILARTPRFEPDGLLLEPAQTNEMITPFAVANDPTYWHGNSEFTISTVKGLYDGESGYKHTNANNPGPSRRQYTPSSLNTPFQYTGYFDIENIDADVTGVGLYRSTPSPGFVAHVQHNWLTGLSTITSSEVDVAGGSELITTNGPNGGEVRRIWITGKPSTNGTGVFYLYPMGYSTNTQSAVVHHAFFDSAVSYFSSPVDGTRVADLLDWDSVPVPQAMVLYCRYVARTPGANTSRLLSIGDAGTTNSAKLYIDETTGTDALKLHFNNGTDAAVEASVPLTQEIGDLVEVVAVLQSTGAIRILARKNGGAVQATAASAPASGLPSSWTTFFMHLNSRSNQHVGLRKYQQYTIVKEASLEADTSGAEDEALVNELAGLYLSADSQRVSNTIAQSP